MIRPWLGALAGAAALFMSGAALAERPIEIDRVVARFWAPDTGGVRSPHFIYQRVLAFEARLEALSDPNWHADSQPYRERHLTDAIERHVAETLLASSHIDPEPDEATIVRQIQAARARLLERVGGADVLERAAAAEGVGGRDLLVILRRQARASLYLDRMVAPMLEPSEAELRTLHRTRHNPYRELPFERIETGLRRYYVSQRLAAAVQNFYQSARTRVVLTFISEQR